MNLSRVLSSLINKQASKNHKSTEFRSQWQAARQFIHDHAFFDRLNGESVCLSTPNDIADHLVFVFGYAIPQAIPRIEPGLIIADSRGEGAFQHVQLVA